MKRVAAPTHAGVAARGTLRGKGRKTRSAVGYEWPFRALLHCACHTTDAQGFRNTAAAQFESCGLYGFTVFITAKRGSSGNFWALTDTAELAPGGTPQEPLRPSRIAPIGLTSRRLPLPPVVQYDSAGA